MLSLKKHCFTPHICRKHIIPPSLNTLYAAESAQFDSAAYNGKFNIALFFAENAKFDYAFLLKTLKMISKMHSYEDNAKFHSAFLVITLSYATLLWRKWEVIKNYEHLGKFEDFRKRWLYCVLYLLVFERCKKA
jgi:hypothetical protein